MTENTRAVGDSIGDRVRDALRTIAPAAHLRDAGIATALLTPVVIIAAYSWVWLENVVPTEFSIFGPAGAAMLQGNFSAVYAEAANQAGPLELAPYGAGYLLNLSGTVAWTTFHAVGSVALLYLFLIAVLAPITVEQRRVRTYLALSAGGVACLTNFVPGAFMGGHPAQVVIPALWVLAGVSARRNHFATAGILVALSAGWEVWGVLGAPVVLVAAHPNVLRAVIAAAATGIVLYLPFLATGNFEMGQYEWPQYSRTLIYHLFPTLTEFTWPLRLAQGGFALAIGSFVARGTRRSEHSVWLAGLAIVAARLVLDPVQWNYYWYGAGVLLIIGAALAASRRHVTLTIALAAVAVWISPNAFQTYLPPTSIAGVVALFCFATIAAPVWVTSRREASVDPRAES